MSRLCRAVLVALVLLPGCYELHGRAGELDAGPPARADGGPLPVDAAVPPSDAPIATRCPLVRADATCMESFAIEAGRPFELPFQYDGCGCCVETSCDSVLDVGSRTLRLSTGLCPDPCDCDACITPRGSCSVPAIPSTALGQWTVEVNGVVAFAIGVVESADPTMVPAPPGCATYAEVDSCGATPDLTTGPIRGDICVDRLQRDERQVLRVHNPCWRCQQLDSACSVIVATRLTADFPPGGDITLHARDYSTNCDIDCPGVCIEHIRECDLPPLEPGSFYRVFVDGEVVHSFFEGEPSALCASM